MIPKSRYAMQCRLQDICYITLLQFMFEIYQENIAGVSSSKVNACKKDAKKGVVIGTCVVCKVCTCVYFVLRAFFPFGKINI